MNSKLFGFARASAPGLKLAVVLLSMAAVLVPFASVDAQDNAGTPPVTETLPPASSGDVPANADPGPKDSYTQQETLDAAREFFGGTSAGLAKAIERAFSQNGQPVGYIIGEEGSGAFVLGLRYGNGILKYKNGSSMQVYWQGPSIGFDIGGNGSKVFTLVYNLRWTNDLFQRFPGVDGSLYVVAGVGLNYLRANGITLAPIRTGVGLRAGASVGYLSFTRQKSYNPF